MIRLSQNHLFHARLFCRFLMTTTKYSFALSLCIVGIILKLILIIMFMYWDI